MSLTPSDAEETRYIREAMGLVVVVLVRVSDQPLYPILPNDTIKLPIKK